MAPLKQLRKESGKSRAKVAADLQISERHLFRLETGATPLQRRWALAFAAYYGVDVDAIDEAAA